MKIVKNVRIGGFGLSIAAGEWLRDNKGWTINTIKTDDNVEHENCDAHWYEVGGVHNTISNQTYLSSKRENRADPDLVECVETLKEKANSKFACLTIVEIPDDVIWQIEEDDSGVEWISEKHRTW